MEIKKPVSVFCSFCGVSNEKRERIITGPNVAICNECILLCVDLLNEPKGVMG
jgi:ATP-dependent Clp protease ATP-binding subunit ClpX